MWHKLLAVLELALLAGMILLSFFFLYSYFQEGEQAVNGTASVTVSEDGIAGAAEDVEDESEAGGGTRTTKNDGQTPDAAESDSAVTACELICSAATEGIDIRIRILDNAFEDDVFETISVRGSGGIFAESGTYGDDFSFYADGLSGDAGNSRSMFVEPDTVYTVAADELRERAVLRLTSGDGGTLTVTSLERADGSPEYSGELYIYRLEEGLALVNVLPVEEYLYAVVSSEMPSYFPEEAQKAQAVCARTYALLCAESSEAEYGLSGQGTEMRLTSENSSETETETVTENEKNEKMIADLDDSAQFQVYNNRQATDTSREAVDATYGEVLMLDEVLYYSTSCLSEHRTDLGEEEAFRSFLLETPEENAEYGSAWLRWSVALPASLILERLAENYNFCADSLEKISVETRSGGGQAQLLRVVADEKVIDIEGEYAIRQLLSPEETEVVLMDGTTVANLSLLPSAFFCIDLTDSSDGASEKSDHEPDAADGTAKEPDDGSDDIVSLTPVLYIYGGGYGHGTGMSQYGAAQMAAEGADYKEILEYYYDTGDE